MAYDPRGQLIRTLGPDGSEQRVIYGVPRDLTHPDRVSPTPWELYTYDANDNAGRTHTAASAGYSHHWNTPTSALFDALGRTVESVARTRSVQAPAQPPPPVQEHRTRSTYDIQGNLRTATDPLGREILRYAYDLLQHSLRVTSLDAGTRLTVLDAQANPVEQRDGRGAVLLRAFDRLNRPVRVWASDGAGRPLTLRERLEYGDGGDPAQTPGERDAGRATNRLGKLFRYYDEAGLLTFESYDFKGNVLERTRRVISDASLLAPGGGAGDPESSFQVDWEPPQGTSLAEHAENILDPTEFRTSFTYDALARVTALGYPQGVDGERRRLRPLYNRAGTLAGVEMDGELYVSRIAYNAKGQRLLVAYANGLMTRYAYDPRMFRLARLRTERFDQVVPNTYQPSGAPLQDLTHGYDLVGNRTTEIDRTPGSGFLNNPDALRFQTSDPQLAQQLAAGDALVRTFRYDPLYRLTAATGREGSTFPAPRPWSDDPRPGYNSGSHGTPSQDSAPNLTAGYLESYAYDPAGNLVTMRHDSAAGATWTRHFGVGGLTPAQWQQEWQARLNAAGPWPNPPGNPLTHVGDDQPGVPQTHDFDANGNLTSETTSRHFEWDHSDRMRGFRVQAGAGPPSLQAQYLYDGRGQRVKKLVRRGGNDYDVTVYPEGGFEYHRQVRPSGIQENNTLHVMDDRSRIASVRVGAAFPDDGAPGVRVRYHLGDHLGSVTLLIGGAAASAATFINREEYFPYGETSFGSFGRKRYRFVGKERDEESGLYYCEARYYAAPFGRWASCDPLGLQGNGDHNLYRYVRGNPLRLVDPTGKEEGEAFVNLGTRQEGRGVPRAGPLRAPGGPLEGLKLISLEEVQAAQGGPKINLGKLGPLRGSAAYVSRVLQGEFPAVKAIRVDLKGLAQLLESELKNPTTAARGGASRFHAFEEFKAIRRLFARGETAKVDIVFTNEVGENFLVKKGTSIIEQVKTPGAGSSALRTGGLVLGTTLGLIFSGLGGLHVGGGIDDITQGKRAEGLNKVITGGTGLVVSLGGAKAVEAGLISAGAGAGGLFLAGLAFGGSLVLAEQSVEAGLKNQDTPLEIAEKYYVGFSGTQMYGQPLSQSWREFKAAFGHLWR
jgi:RHS repeat-associated protein